MPSNCLGKKTIFEKLTESHQVFPDKIGRENNQSFRKPISETIEVNYNNSYNDDISLK